MIESWEIPFYEPYYDDQEVRAAWRAIKSGWTTQGQEVEAFEKEAAVVLGAPEGDECIAVSNCTAALYLLFQSLGIGTEHKKVAIPNLTFAATINAALAAGAKPMLCDVDDDGQMVDSEELWGEYVPVHVRFAGALPVKECIAYGVWDQAHSFEPGAYIRNSAWSFFPTKNITAGEGGLIGCCSERAAEIRARRNHGRTSMYDVDYPGSLNFRMTDIQAAILRVQLGKLTEIIIRKREIDKVYREILEGHVTLPPQRTSHLFWIRHGERDWIKDRLAEKGIQTSIHFRPLSLMPAFRQYANGQHLEASEKMGREILSLPFFPDLGVKRAGIVAKAVVEAVS